MRFTRSALACVLLLGTAACNRDGQPVDPGVVHPEPAEPVATLEFIPPAASEPPFSTAQPATIRVRARDAAGRPVQGARLVVVLQAQYGQTASVSMTTGADGIGSAAWQPHQGGRFQVSIRVEGGHALMFLEVEVRGPRAQFTVDSVFLAGIGCAYEFELASPWPDRSLFRGYTIDQPGVIRAVSLGGRTGTFSWAYTAVFAVAPGSATVTGHHVHGNAHATVHVGNGLPRVVFNPQSPPTAAVGDTAMVTAMTYGACGNPITAYPSLDGSLTGDTAYVRGYTLDPEVLEVDQARPSWGIGGRIIFIGKRPGQARVVAHYRGAADTVVVTVN